MAIILPKLEGQGYECLCGATYKYYMCRCTEGCKEDNLISVKGDLITSNKKI